MSSAGAALLRAVLHRALVSRDRILLTECRSVDWQSLTFMGERHEFGFRLTGRDADDVFAAITDGLEHADLAIPKGFVAEIALSGEPVRFPDGSIVFRVEALTLEE